MKLRSLNSELWLPVPRSEVFPFFADPENLQALTPEWLDFNIVSPRPIVMEAGRLIDYRLKVHGIPIQWRARISVWEPPFRFVDEQVKGPYRAWIHEHLFQEVQGGTQVIDRVQYAAIGGELIEKLFVRRDVEKIFEYRSRKLIERFGASK